MAQKITQSQIKDVDYSTSEVDTGVKWTNGKTIYRKTVTFSIASGSQNTATSHGISGMDTLVNFDGVYRNADPLNWHQNSAWYLFTRVTPTQIAWVKEGSHSGTAIIHIYYTKT